LNGSQAHFLLEQGKKREDRLAVSIIEEANAPQHPHDVPFVSILIQ
jgi:hypothetical protein